MSTLAVLMSDASSQMRLTLSTIRSALTHNLSEGEAAEEALREFLRARLPASLGVGTGQIIDATGDVSKQLDVVIYDVARTPILFASDSGGHQLFPCEGVVAVVEVKTMINASDMVGVVANMTSVKRLQKSAYYEQTLIQKTVNVHGTDVDVFPTLYFLFAFDSGALPEITVELSSLNAALPLDKRVDAVCILTKGVIVNVLPDGNYSGTPRPGSALGHYHTENALLLWYLMMTHFLLQAEIRNIRLLDYMPKDFSF